MSDPGLHLFSIPPGAPFLPSLAEALLSGRLIAGFDARDPLALAGVTIYLPTRRAARELRSVLVGKVSGGSAILPTIRALGEFDEEGAVFDAAIAGSLDLAPPIAPLDRLLLLAKLVRAWKRRLPAHVAQLFEEEVIVPASAADAIWHARDLAALMDEIETERADWSRLADLVPGELAGWWQVTLEFLSIVTHQWPAVLAERGQSNPAAHRSRLMALEAERLRRSPAAGPVIAAGSTGSIPATAELLSVIARLPQGAVVLPGLDTHLDAPSWSIIDDPAPEPAVLGHPQFGLAKLLRKLGATREDVTQLASLHPDLQVRKDLVSDALRPAVTTDAWASGSAVAAAPADVDAALAGVTLVEAANERDEAAAIAVALKRAAQRPDARVALVTGDRNLARRVSTELLRLGVVADDSGGTPLTRTSPAELLTLLLEAVFRPGDPVPVVALLKHPLLTLGLERALVRRAFETVELVALRGGTGRPDAAQLPALFEERLAGFAGDVRQPHWLARLNEERLAEARTALASLGDAIAPLAALREARSVDLAEIARQTIQSFETLGRSADGGLEQLYAGEAGATLAEFLRSLVGSDAAFDLVAGEWPDVFAALISPEVVKPNPGAESRIAIWGQLEARLQTVDMLVLGGLNEGVWPRKAQADRFMSRMMKSGLELEPPERRIGLAAHDFMIAMGTGEVVLTRAARSGDAPALASRWLQRLLTYVGDEQAGKMRARGNVLLDWARQLDAGDKQPFARRPEPKPPLEARPRKFSVTEIETLRRDPYAIYAKRILGLQALDPLVRDPGAADRGTLFHDILHRFTESGVDALGSGALDGLVDIGHACFAEIELPPDVHAIWWPRFLRMAPEILAWEARRAAAVRSRHAEAAALALEVARTGVTLSGRADRIDILSGGMAVILDYKTGSSPSKGQAHTLLSPQLALEGALLRRGAFRPLGTPNLSDLAFVRLRPNGLVNEESILEYNRNSRPADDLAEDAWRRLEELILHYQSPATGYLSRALPFREGDTEGDYDHLARVLEWSAGGGDAEGEGS
ncbi:double-strand break repair protein AddB [Arvimicrobium flavum]|uniref:double-strand break repair protein AddB n=1 Tax=Arvimicrobium flavum TaxID=3393320 RepID=UPI00237B259A|nr:double-strand break repair protein AddB [Mesorhizobium shangrilense]